MSKVIVQHKETGHIGIAVEFKTQVLQIEDTSKTLPTKKETVVALAIVCWQDEDNTVDLCPVNLLKWEGFLPDVDVSPMKEALEEALTEEPTEEEARS